MNGRGDTSERRTFAVVMTVVFGSVLTMLLLQPGDAAHAALSATTVPPEDGRKPVTPATGLLEVLPDALLQPVEVRTIERVVVQDDVKLPRVHDDRIAGWVDDLRDDQIQWNGGLAMSHLSRLPAGDIPELEQALRSLDAQQRHFAAAVLRDRCDTGRARPSQDLLRVSVDALRSDLGATQDAYYSARVGSLRVSSARFLRHHAVAAGALLADKLTSINAQQRFLSAYLLAQAGLTERTGHPGHAGRIAFELMGHLSDNKITGDALMATHGLYRVGDAALPILLDNRRFMDPQARKLIDLIQLDLKSPPRTKQDLYKRSGYSVSSIYHDAAIEYDMRRSPIPQIPGR